MLGGMRLGWFTPTEATLVAVVAVVAEAVEAVAVA